MATFITLINYTDQGIRDIKDSPSRLDSVKELVRDLGGEMTHFYLTMGNYDLVAICELPADESAAQLALKLGSLGSVRTTTLRAFPEPEYRKIIEELP